MNAKGTDLFTPLHSASYYGCVDIVKWLLEKGADINIENRSGETPLHLARRLRREEVIKLLLDKQADKEAIKQPNQLIVTKNNNQQPSPIEAADENTIQQSAHGAHTHAEVGKWLSKFIPKADLTNIWNV